MTAFPTRTAAGLLVAAALATGCSDQPAPAAPSTPPAATPAAAPAAALPPVDASRIKISEWGPKATQAGTGFAVQPSGNSAIWFKHEGIPSAESVDVWFGQTKLAGKAIVANGAGSAEVPKELLQAPGKHAVYLTVNPGGARVELGTFEVVAKAP